MNHVILCTPVYHGVFVTCITFAKMAAVGCLPNAKVVVWMQTIMYFAVVILGLFITIPMGVLLVSLCIHEFRPPPWKYN